MPVAHAGRMDDASKLDGRVRAAQGNDAVRDGDLREERRDEGAKEGQRQPMADEVDQDEPAAGPSDIPDQAGELFICQMMREAERVGDVGLRQRVMNGVGLHDGNGGIGGWTEVNADDVDAEALAHVRGDAAVSAADIEDAADGQGIAADGVDDARGVAEKVMQSREVAIGALHDGRRKRLCIEQLGFKGSRHGESSARASPVADW